ncbi:WD40 repeat domain-containing protein [Nostoc sp. UIC 10890]
MFSSEPSKLDNTKFHWSDFTTQEEEKNNQFSYSFPSFSHDSKKMISVQKDGSIFTLDLFSKKRELLTKIDPYFDNDIVNIVVSNNHNKIAIARKNKTIEHRSFSQKQPGKLFKLPKGNFHSMIFNSKNGNLFLASYEKKNGTVYVWEDVSLEKPLLELEAEPVGLSFDPDGGLLVYTMQQAGGAAMTLFSWKFDKNIKTLENYLNLTAYNQIKVSPDNRLIAITDDNKEGIIELWDFRNKKLLTEFQVHQNIKNNGYYRNERISFSYDSSLMITIGADGRTKLWRIGDLDYLLSKGCDHVRDYLKNNPNIEEGDRHLCNGVPKPIIPFLRKQNGFFHP